MPSHTPTPDSQTTHSSDIDPRFTQQYKAFISYSHADNREQGRKWADWLHHSLETYEVPTELIGKPNMHGEPIPAQIYPIFQDEKELSANADLSASLQNALNNTEFLIYLSSPRSACSVYVQEELKHFKKMGKADKIIALIVSGEPEYGDTQTEQQCFPDALRYDVDAEGNILYDHHAEALAADVRLPETSEEGFTSSEGYRRYLQDKDLPNEQIKALVDTYQERLNLAKLKIISTILGVPLRELTQRDKSYQLERQKRKTRIVQRVAAAIGILGLMAAGSGVYAWHQKNESQKNFAQSLFTSGINKLAQNEYGDPAAYIAAAVRSGSKNATEFAESMLVIRDDMVLMPNLISTETSYSPDGHYIAGFADMGNQTFTLQLWDAFKREKIGDILTITKLSPTKPLFDNAGNLYANDGNGHLIRYEPASQKMSVVYTAPLDTASSSTSATPNATPSSATAITVKSETPSTSGASSASAVATTTVSNSVPNSAPTSAPSPTILAKSRPIQFEPLAVSGDGQWIAIRLYETNNGVEIVHRDTGQTMVTNFPPFYSREAVFAQNNQGQANAVLVYGSTERSKQSKAKFIRLSADKPELAHEFDLPYSIYHVKMADDASDILFAGNGGIYQIFNTNSKQFIPLQAQEKTYRNIKFNPDGRTLMAWASDGYDVYDRHNGQPLEQQNLTLNNIPRLFEWQIQDRADYAPDYSQRLMDMNRQLYLRNENGNPLITHEFEFPKNYKDILATPDGKTLAMLSKDQLVISKFDVESEQLTPNFLTFEKPVHLFETLTNQRLMTRDNSGTIRFFDLTTGKQIGKDIKAQAKAISFNHIGKSGDGKSDGLEQSQMLTRMTPDTIGIWQISDGALLKQFKLPSKDSNFRADEQFRYLIIADDKTWQVKAIDTQEILLTGQGKLNNGVFSGDGKWLTVGSDQSEIQVYNLAEKKLAFRIPSINTPLMAFTPDGKTLLASVNNRRLRLFHTETGQAYGQIIPVYPDTKLLHFSQDGSKLFIQDSMEKMSPSVKVIDVSTGNLISLPFANGLFSNVQLVKDNRQLVTSDNSLTSYKVTVWQMPTGFNIPPEQLASDLENFYARKYDPESGAIISIDPNRQYKTWFFQDIYSRPIAPDSTTTINDAIGRLLPIQNPQQISTLSGIYFYHPLARAGLAEYFSRTAGTGSLSQDLIKITELQLQRLNAQGAGNAELINKVQQLLTQAKQQLETAKTKPTYATQTTHNAQLANVSVVSATAPSVTTLPASGVASQ